MQSFVKHTAFYHRMKASPLYDLFWALNDRQIIERRTGEVRFYQKLLSGFQPGGLVFDVGANQGAKTDIFLRLGARVIAVEPDEANQAVLKHKFLRLRLKRKPVTIIGKAVSDSRSVQTMWIDAPGSAKNTLSRKWVETLREDAARFGQKLDFRTEKTVATITLEDLIATRGKPFFIKIDVEGMEPSVLRGLRSSVPFLSFEVNLPEFMPEGLDCIEILRLINSDGEFNYAVDCQTGLASSTWLDANAFSQQLARCTESSIEVFWRTLASGTK
jgi:FkbM family methyltransferase